MISITFEYAQNLNTLSADIAKAVHAKVRFLTEELEQKVLANIMGKVLQTRTGQLASSLHETFEEGTWNAKGSVFIEPVTPKALALELGGKGFYEIIPTKAKLLHFYWDKVGKEVWLSSVMHPPSKAFAYFGSALEGFEAHVMDSLNLEVEAVLSRVGD